MCTLCVSVWRVCVGWGLPTYVHARVLVVRVLQSQCRLLQLLPLIGQLSLRLVKLKALPQEAAGTLHCLTLLE